MAVALRNLQQALELRGHGNTPFASAAIESALLTAAATALFALLMADWMAELALSTAETDATLALLRAISSDISAAEETDCSFERTEETD